MEFDCNNIVVNNYYLFGAGETCKSFLAIDGIKENLTILGIVNSEPQKLESTLRGYTEYRFLKELFQAGC